MALRPQVLLLTVDCFPHDGIELPYPPCTSVDWVKYIDPLGVEQTLSTDVYETATEGKYTWVRRQFEQDPRQFMRLKRSFVAADSLHVQAHVAVQNMTELMSNDSLQLLPAQPLQGACAAGDYDQR